MSEPGDAEGQESVWARLEREDREDAERNFWPLLLIRTSVLYFALPIAADAFGWSPPPASLWVVICLAFGHFLVGWLLYRSRPIRP